MSDDAKECPFCAETIKAKAIKCKHCGSDLTTPLEMQGYSMTAPQSKTMSTFNFLMILCLVLTICGALFYFIWTQNTKIYGSTYDNIFEAVRSKDTQAVKDFIRKKPRLVNAKDYEGWTPLHSAILRGHTEIAKLLIEKGADVNAKDKGGDTPLHLAPYMGDTEIAKFLIDNGADVNAKNKDGNTPLQYAAYGGHTEMAKLLISGGADVNAKTNDGRTPLYAAAMWGHTNTAKLLIEKGADVNAKDKSSTTPLKMAIKKKHRKTADLLRKHGAKY